MSSELLRFSILSSPPSAAWLTKALLGSVTTGETQTRGVGDGRGAPAEEVTPPGERGTPYEGKPAKEAAACKGHGRFPVPTGSPIPIPQREFALECQGCRSRVKVSERRFTPVTVQDTGDTGRAFSTPESKAFSWLFFKRFLLLQLLAPAYSQDFP